MSRKTYHNRKSKKTTQIKKRNIYPIINSMIMSLMIIQNMVYMYISNKHLEDVTSRINTNNDVIRSVMECLMKTLNHLDKIVVKQSGCVEGINNINKSIYEMQKVVHPPIDYTFLYTGIGIAVASIVIIYSFYSISGFFAKTGVYTLFKNIDYAIGQTTENTSSLIRRIGWSTTDVGVNVSTPIIKNTSGCIDSTNHEVIIGRIVDNSNIVNNNIAEATTKVGNLINHDKTDQAIDILKHIKLQKMAELQQVASDSIPLIENISNIN